MSLTVKEVSDPSSGADTRTFLVVAGHRIVAQVPKREGWQKALSAVVKRAATEYGAMPLVAIYSPEMEAYASPLEDGDQDSSPPAHASGEGDSRTFVVLVKGKVVATVSKNEGWQQALSDAIDRVEEEYKIPPHIILLSGSRTYEIGAPLERELWDPAADGHELVS